MTTWIRIPLVSMSKVTSICGTPRGAGGRLLNSNFLNKQWDFVIAHSPVQIENDKKKVARINLANPEYQCYICDFLTGIVDPCLTSGFICS
jgi:hypothetical protein